MTTEPNRYECPLCFKRWMEQVSESLPAAPFTKTLCEYCIHKPWLKERHPALLHRRLDVLESVLRQIVDFMALKEEDY